MRRWLAALALVVAAGAAPAPAHAELKSIWGPNTLPGGGSAFPTYDRLGVDVLQRQLQWDLVAPTRPAHPRDPDDPAYHWPADLDYASTQARRHHMRLALMIKDAPPWANGGRDAGWAPTKASDVADFAVAAARYYRRVRYWMVWGEPARPGNFEPVQSAPRKAARRYARILDASYGALKSVRRSNVVIGGMTYDAQTPHITRWLHWMRLPGGRPPRLDWFGHNPYGTRYPNLRLDTYSPLVRDMSDLDTLYREVRRAYAPLHRRPKLWLSEFNVQSSHSSRAFSFFVSRDDQAKWLTAAYRLAHALPFVAGLGWYELLDQRGRYGLTGGLMTWNGKRKPAWQAYRRAR
jgi:hypothetical protein